MESPAHSSSIRERRTARRYAIRIELEYLANQGGQGASGRGRTIDISRTGILFSSTSELPTNAAIELSVFWPAHRPGVDIRFCATGHTVRSDCSLTAVKIEKYEFSTKCISDDRRR